MENPKDPMLTKDFERLMVTANNTEIIEAYRQCKHAQEFYMKAFAQSRGDVEKVEQSRDHEQNNLFETIKFWRDKAEQIENILYMYRQTEEYLDTGFANN